MTESLSPAANEAARSLLEAMRQHAKDSLASLNNEDLAAVQTRLYQLVTLHYREPGNGFSPNGYEALSDLMESIGEPDAAAHFLDKASRVTLGEGRAARYRARAADIRARVPKAGLT